jgi:hypothetical protein
VTARHARSSGGADQPRRLRERRSHPIERRYVTIIVKCWVAVPEVFVAVMVTG